MRHYRVKLIAETSLHLGRDRATRVSRHSRHYIPASTISGAVNTFLYQRGLYHLMGQFRFTNLYIAEDDERVWIPTPRNVLVCPACKEAYVVKRAGDVWEFEDLICTCPARALRKPYKGFILVQSPGPASFVIPQEIRLRRQAVEEAWLLGRTAHDRWRGIQQSGKLHFVEILPSNSRLIFQGYISVSDKASALPSLLTGARLRVGGLLSRGCGRARLTFQRLELEEMVGGKLLVIESPLLPLALLPPRLKDRLRQYEAVTTSQIAQIGICERWSIKLESEVGGGLLSFPNVLDISSVIQVDEKVEGVSEALFFYEIESGRLRLYMCPFKLGSEAKSQIGPYSLTELWSLGFGKLRYLHF